MKKILYKLIGLVLGVLAVIACIKLSKHIMGNVLIGLPIGMFIAASIRQLTNKITNKL
ncbi:hypothetical protein ACFX4I_26070 [Peribacillus sp. YIM B13472]|uniref:hypothetical protein n=1 Tax=Peribacillus sp. YIM B13472 TaxID=3366297 RepID=UPI00366D44DD